MIPAKSHFIGLVMVPSRQASPPQVGGVVACALSQSVGDDGLQIVITRLADTVVGGDEVRRIACLAGRKLQLEVDASRVRSPPARKNHGYNHN